MKFLLLFIGCIGLSISGICQKIRFTNTSNQWKTLLVVVDAPGAYYTDLVNSSFGNDTIIAGASYRLLSFRSFIERKLVALREDSVQGSIYFRVPGSADTAEHLLFDYRLKVGDTLKIGKGTDAWEHKVQAIDSIQLGSIYHKRWHLVPVAFPPPYPPAQYDFIEGLGTQYGPTFGIYPSIFEHGYQLRCFSTNGSNPVCSPPVELPFGNITRVFPNNFLPAQYFDNLISCSFETTGVGAEISDQVIQITPNPGISEMTLTLPASIVKADLQVSDMMGRTCLVLGLNNRKTSIGKYLPVPGVYTYTLQDAVSGQRYTGRFIIR